MEGGVEAVALHRELALPGDEALPGQGTGALKQGVEVLGREGAQHQQHPLPGAQVQIQTGEVQGGALAEHPPVSARTWSRPRRRSSSAVRPSTPNRVGTEKVSS